MKRWLAKGQVYTSHDGSGLYREVVHFDKADPAKRVLYRTNRGPGLHGCHRSTFIEWLRFRKARKTQKNRVRKL